MSIVNAVSSFRSLATLPRLPQLSRSAMPKKHPAKKARKGFDVSVLQEQLVDYHKDKLLHVVDRVCRLSMTEVDGLTDVAKALLSSACHADLADRKAAGCARP